MVSLFVMTCIFVFASERKIVSMPTQKSGGNKALGVVLNKTRKWSKIVCLFIFRRFCIYVLPRVKMLLRWTAKHLFVLYKKIERRIGYVLNTIQGKRTIKDDGNISHYLRDITDHKEQAGKDPIE